MEYINLKMKFINREKELKSLRERWKSKKAEFFVIYGKRRVGKTELIKQFIKNKPSIYFLADKRNTREQLKELGEIVGNYFNDQILKSRGFVDWIEVFSYLKSKIKKRIVFVVDEYPYLVENDPSTSSLFQKGWDEHLKFTKIFLILCGSSVSMMESEALIYKSPLYGRRTGQLLLNPLSFFESWQFFPEKSFDKFLSIFTITGGIPAYLLQFDPKKSVEENIKTKIFPKTEFLHNEIEFILKEELREPKNYLSILRAISFGKRKFGEIANETGLEKNILMKYLTTLMNLQLIEKEIPITEKTPEKSRKGIYKISDNFTRFWFQYIFPYKSYLEMDRYEEMIRKLRENFKLLEAHTYEKVCQEILWKIRDKIFPFERVSRWWDKNEEIDVVGLNENTKEIIFGEAKYSRKEVDVDVYFSLKKKSAFVNWNYGKRKEYYILFSKSGFTEKMKEVAKKENVFLVEKDNLIWPI